MKCLTIYYPRDSKASWPLTDIRIKLGYRYDPVAEAGLGLPPREERLKPGQWHGGVIDWREL